MLYSRNRRTKQALGRSGTFLIRNSSLFGLEGLVRIVFITDSLYYINTRWLKQNYQMVSHVDKANRSIKPQNIVTYQHRLQVDGDEMILGALANGFSEL